MAILITGWVKNQASAIGNITRSRLRQNAKAIEKGLEPLPLHRPYTMEKLLVCRKFDRDFAEFAQKVGTRQAETFWIRTLQYVTDGEGLTGLIDVSRGEFGPLVLSRRTRYTDRVSARLGGKVYDALIDSGLASEVDESLSEGLPGTHSGALQSSSPSPSTSPSGSGAESAGVGDEGRGSGCPGGQPRPLAYFMGGIVQAAGEAASELSNDELVALQEANRKRSKKAAK